MTENMNLCKHMDFAASVLVNRLEDTGRFMADVSIRCAHCNEPFQFLWLKPGLDMAGAAVDLEGTELRVAILPSSQMMSPIQRIMSGVQ